jgi:hypothetical protein
VLGTPETDLPQPLSRTIHPVQEALWVQPWSAPAADESFSPYPWSIGKLSVSAVKYASELRFHGEVHHFPSPPGQLGSRILLKSYSDAERYISNILEEYYQAGGTNAEQFLLPEKRISLSLYVSRFRRGVALTYVMMYCFILREIQASENGQPTGFHTGISVTRAAIQRLCMSLLKKSATQRLDEEYAFRPSIVISSSQSEGDPSHEKEAFILGAAIALHLLWCGCLPANFSILQFWLVINRRNTQCFTKSILEKYAPELFQSINEWRSLTDGSAIPDRLARFFQVHLNDAVS